MEDVKTITLHKWRGGKEWTVPLDRIRRVEDRPAWCLVWLRGRLFPTRTLSMAKDIKARLESTNGNG